MAYFDGYQFQRECYLRSTPSVDLDKVTTDNPVNCSHHKLLIADYDAILRDWSVTDENNQAIDERLYLACNMWMLQSGPLLVSTQNHKEA